MFVCIFEFIINETKPILQTSNELFATDNPTKPIKKTEYQSTSTAVICVTFESPNLYINVQFQLINVLLRCVATLCSFQHVRIDQSKFNIHES